MSGSVIIQFTTSKDYIMILRNDLYFILRKLLVDTQFLQLILLLHVAIGEIPSNLRCHQYQTLAREQNDKAYKWGERGRQWWNFERK